MLIQTLFLCPTGLENELIEVRSCSNPSLLFLKVNLATIVGTVVYHREIDCVIT